MEEMICADCGADRKFTDNKCPKCGSIMVDNTPNAARLMEALRTIGGYPIKTKSAQ